MYIHARMSRRQCLIRLDSCIPININASVPLPIKTYIILLAFLKEVYLCQTRCSCRYSPISPYADVHVHLLLNVCRSCAHMLVSIDLCLCICSVLPKRVFITWPCICLSFSCYVGLSAQDFQTRQATQDRASRNSGKQLREGFRAALFRSGEHSQHIADTDGVSACNLRVRPLFGGKVTVSQPLLSGPSNGGLSFHIFMLPIPVCACMHISPTCSLPRLFCTHVMQT